MGCRPGRSTTWSRPSASTPGSPSPRCPGSARTSIGGPPLAGEEVAAFRGRSLKEDAYPYVFLDATYCKARVNRRVVSQAVVVATAVRADGHREVLGFDVGDSEDGAFWTAFLRSLKARGLHGGAAGDLRRPRRPQGRDRRGVRRRRVATLPGPLPPQRADPDTEGQRRDGPPQAGGTPSRRHPHGLRPTRPAITPSTSTPSSTSSPACSANSSRSSSRCCATPRTTCWPSPASRSGIGRRSGPPTRSSGSTRRSNAAPTSSASSPTPKPCRLAGAVLVVDPRRMAVDRPPLPIRELHEDRHHRHQGGSHSDRTHGVTAASKASRRQPIVATAWGSTPLLHDASAFAFAIRKARVGYIGQTPLEYVSTRRRRSANR